MYILRSLIIFSILLNHVTTLAKVKSVSLSTTSSEYQIKSEAVTSLERLQNNIKEVSISANEIQLSGNWKATVTVLNNIADYSNYLVYDSTATNSSSLAGKLTESNLQIDQIYTRGAEIYQVLTSSNFGTTPLRKSNLSFVYLKKLNLLSILGLHFSAQKQNVPKNYFLNPTNNNLPEKRPEELDTQSLDLSFEHIYSDRYKNKFELSVGQRIQDRPVLYGINMNNLYVLTDFSGLRFDLGYLAESRSDKLKNDLGYQESKWFESKWIQSFNSYLNFGIGYATEVHTEFKEWQNTTEQLGNDQILFDLSYDQPLWSLNVSSAFAKYNTGQSGSNLKMEFMWKL